MINENNINEQAWNEAWDMAIKHTCMVHGVTQDDIYIKCGEIKFIKDEYGLAFMQYFDIAYNELLKDKQ